VQLIAKHNLCQNFPLRHTAQVKGGAAENKNTTMNHGKLLSQSVAQIAKPSTYQTSDTMVCRQSDKEDINVYEVPSGAPGSHPKIRFEAKALRDCPQWCLRF
jgi:hypothetical protein